MNQITVHHRPHTYYQGMRTYHDFQERIFCHALDRYQAMMGSDQMGSVLAVCSTSVEAEFLTRYPFEQIVISGLGDQEANVIAAGKGDRRVSYREENCEAISYPSRSFDLVFCKFGLHHLPRPIQGLYEMMRCCRKAAILIEPYDSPGRRLIEFVGRSTMYERARRNPNRRDNYVYPFDRRQLETLLNSYYLDSGYQLELHPGWYSARFTVGVPHPVGALLSSIGWAMQYLPGARGNLLTAIIQPGANLPRETFMLGDDHTVTDLGI